LLLMFKAVSFKLYLLKPALMKLIKLQSFAAVYNVFMI